MLDSQQAIAAIATAPGRGAVGIVRISGPDLRAFVPLLLGRTLAARQATYLSFPDAHGQPIDQGLAIWFPAPHSYTGEDVLELQAHGGPVGLQMLLARCFAVGAALPLVVVALYAGPNLAVAVAFAALAALALLGALAAATGGADLVPGVVRVTFWSALAMAVTYGVGTFFGTVVA